MGAPTKLVLVHAAACLLFAILLSVARLTDSFFTLTTAHRGDWKLGLSHYCISNLPVNGTGTNATLSNAATNSTGCFPLADMFIHTGYADAPLWGDQVALIIVMLEMGCCGASLFYALMLKRGRSLRDMLPDPTHAKMAYYGRAVPPLVLLISTFAIAFSWASTISDLDATSHRGISLDLMTAVLVMQGIILIGGHKGRLFFMEADQFHTSMVQVTPGQPSGPPGSPTMLLNAASPASITSPEEPALPPYEPAGTTPVLSYNPHQNEVAPRATPAMFLGGTTQAFNSDSPSASPALSSSTQNEVPPVKPSSSDPSQDPADPPSNVASAPPLSQAPHVVLHIATAPVPTEPNPDSSEGHGERMPSTHVLDKRFGAPSSSYTTPPGYGSASSSSVAPAGAIAGPSASIPSSEAYQPSVTPSAVIPGPSTGFPSSSAYTPSSSSYVAHSSTYAAPSPSMTAASSPSVAPAISPSAPAPKASRGVQRLATKANARLATPASNMLLTKHK